MFRSLRTRKSSAFDRLVGALVSAAAVAFLYTMLFGAVELTFPGLVVPELVGTVTTEVISVDVVAADFAGSLGSLPSFRL